MGGRRGARIAAAGAGCGRGGSARSPAARIPAAAGLAGDPFRSLFDPTAGAWGDRALASPAGARIEAESARPLDGGHTPVELHGSQVSWIAGAPLRVGRTTWGVAGRLTRPAWNAGWGGAASGVSASGGAPEFDLAVRPPLPIKGAQLNVTVPVWSDRDRGAHASSEVSLRWVGVSWLGLAGRATSTQAPDAIRSTLGGEALNTSLNLRGRRVEGEARVVLLPAMIAEGWISSGSFAPLTQRDAALVYHLDPSGLAHDRGSVRSGTVQAARGSWRRGTGRSRNGRRPVVGAASASGISTTRGQRALVAGRRGMAGRDGRGRWLADFESARATAQGRADIESWPFTSTLVDMLGTRRIYRAGGDLRWEAWHVATERAVGGIARMRAGAGWYDLRPNGSLESWRPVFLVFGRADDEFAALDVSRAQIAELALGGNVLVGGFDVGCDVRQIVWGRAVEHHAAGSPGETPAEETPGAATAPSADPSMFPAGGRATITVARHF